MITPSDSPSDPAGYASVLASGFDIQAPQDDLAGAVAAAGALAGAGFLYPQGPRQAAAENLLTSPQGYADFDITAGYSGDGGDSWPNDVSP